MTLCGSWAAGCAGELVVVARLFHRWYRLQQTALPSVLHCSVAVPPLLLPWAGPSSLSAARCSSPQAPVARLLGLMREQLGLEELSE